MRIKYTFIAVIMAVLLLAVSAGCSQNNDTDTSTTVETPTDETVQASASESGTAESEQASSAEEATQTGYSEGNVIPDFSVPLVGGGTFTLSENLGKPVFINLFATWCPPCVGEMPEIDELYSEYGDQVTFIVIDIGEDEATALDFADSNGYSLPFAYSVNGDMFDGYTIQFIPQTFVVDANGVITAYFDRARDYDICQAAIEEALNS